MSNYLDHNRTVFSEHVDELVDPDLVAIDQELLDGRTNATVSARWEAWNATYAALQEALEADAPHLIPHLRALADATGDLAAATDAAAFNRGAGLGYAMRPSPAHPDGISAFEAFQMVPLIGVAAGAV